MLKSSLLVVDDDDDDMCTMDIMLTTMVMITWPRSSTFIKKNSF